MVFIQQVYIEHAISSGQGSTCHCLWHMRVDPTYTSEALGLEELKICRYFEVITMIS